MIGAISALAAAFWLAQMFLFAVFVVCVAMALAYFSGRFD